MLELVFVLLLGLVEKLFDLGDLGRLESAQASRGL